ncbi:glycosyltransferase family 4 protein [Telluribacter sp. SYSU D00476]|uniref:glycosyltransferase family 4 protein n=1 Tax=Telluribacter sp. SYSU D00476 TaxID=2811430 RepID=UPI001FF2D93A|nr:glycosyltransferase family 4 protein [Telluribacter sp. SYSU D00476]
MKVSQITLGRFHHFHLARQMEKFGLLDYIWTGYPLFKLKDEQGIPREKIRSFPWVQAPYMQRGRFGLNRSKWLNREWEWLAKESLDKYVASNISTPTVLISLSGSGLHAGRKTRQQGGIYICDRGSSHIRFQDRILDEEYTKWGLQFKGVDPRVIEKEENEYELADRITVPSEFVKQSFLRMGVPEAKLVKITYGARLDRFRKVADPPKDVFRVLWVGGVSIRKGFMYALEAFQKLDHPKKEFLVIGTVEDQVKQLMKGQDLDGITFKGNVSNTELPGIYSTAHVFLLASLEEGLAMVQGEALACGCPIIATTNTGASDLITDRKEGFIVPIRSSQAILEKLEMLVQDHELRGMMSEAATQKVKSIGGWDAYGNNFDHLIRSLRR